MATSVLPNEIEKRLDQIWEELSLKKRTRACLFNLIVYQQHSKRANYLSEVVQRVVEKFPCRILSITSDVPQKEDLTIQVSISSSQQGEILCDHIQFFIKQDKKTSPVLILPHLVPDLPVYLLFAEDPLNEKELFEEFSQHVARVILDSDSAKDLPLFTKKVLTISEKTSLADLNWARTEAWRDLLATSFDTQESLLNLKKAHKISITYNHIETDFYRRPEIPSLFLHAWLASRLAWNYQKGKREKGSFTFTYTRDDHKPVLFSLFPVKEPKVKPGLILSFSIESETEKGLQLLYKRNQDLPHLVILHTESALSCGIPKQFVLEKTQTGKSLAQEIYCQGCSLHYLTMLQTLLQIDPTLYAQ